MVRPKHLEIRDWIESRISDGTFSEGDRLPTEKQLMEQFSVSRNPVQRAMEGMVEAGLVIRQRGRGTTVASTGLRANLLRHVDTTLRSAPVDTGTHEVVDVAVASSESFPLSRRVMEPQTPAVELTRIKRSGTGEALALERAVISLSYAPDVVETDLDALATTAYYNDRGLPIHKIDSEFHAVHLNREDSAAIGLTETTPVIKQVRRVYSTPTTCIEAAEFFYHPHKLTLEVSQIDSR
ncbi:GntR family transcriptional regulator [Brevibacterium otitidis]|uniref:GntR family transcriptional regulator n=1 Tax=Brevibacterium otitidis TaxID=53364 RepID=A0ABV5X2B2_9MICO|nr:GntR family transcriptional regulator [Brevibacterium otitidis]